MNPLTVQHPNAFVSKKSLIRLGTVAMVGAIVNLDAEVGSNYILNTGCFYY